MGLSLADFIAKYNGTQVDWDGHYGYQCVDLARYWIHNIGGHQLPPLTGGAEDAYAKADTRYWIRIPRKGSALPSPGALIVGTKGSLGHIAIARAGSTSSAFKSFDQNWSKSQRCSLEVHDPAADQIVGWLVKKTTTDWDPELQAKFERRTRNLFIEKYDKLPEDAPKFFETFQSNFLETPEGSQYVGRVKL